MMLLTVLNRAALAVCALAILSMTLLGGLDVLSTALFNQPIPGTYEITEMLMVVTVFLALGHLHQERANIAVDILYERFGFQTQRMADYLALILTGTMAGLMAWRAWDLALRSWQIGEKSVGLIQFPVYPSKFAFAIGCTLLTVCCLADLFKGRDLRMRSASVDESNEVL